MRKALTYLVTALVALAFAAPASAEVKVRFATAAPDGSLQVKVFRAIAKKVKKATDGEVSFKLFAGGTVGDDLGALRKMKLGHIDGAGFSGVGTGEILSESRVFELPFFYKNAKQVDCVRDKMADYWVKKFEEKGYVLLGWADVGSVYLFSKKSIASVSDMGSTKPWVWKGDPVGESTFRAFGLTPTALALQDVLTSLQTGLIDTFYITPAMAIALQWNTYASYMVDMPLVNAMGAVLVKKDVFDKISPENQVKVKEIFAKWLPKLVKKTRKENRTSIDRMVEQGLQRVPVPGAEKKAFRKKGGGVAKELTGKLFPADLLKQIESHRAVCK